MSDNKEQGINQTAKQDLFDMLEQVKDDPCLTNLYWRYMQNLELGDSHWREGMSLEQPSVENAKQAQEEKKIAKEHPYADANQLRLMRKYGRNRGD